MSLLEQHQDACALLAASSRRVAELGYVASHGGNLSYKVAPDVILITPTKVPKRALQADDIVAVNALGEPLEAQAGRKATGETPMHTRIYQERPDLNALVHTHPPVLTGFSMMRREWLTRPLLPEVILEVGPLLMIDYAEPISDDLARQFDKVLRRSNAWIMRNHGFTLGSSEGIERATDFLQMCEAMAVSVQTALSAEGEITEIPREEVENLERTLATRSMPRPGDPREIKSLLDLYDWD
ncbi:MAG: class II aldolase/adducin family protein [Opitutales bacterium]